MDFLEKVGGTIYEKGKGAADKAKLVAEMVSIKGQIAACEEVIKKNYAEIGKRYYEEYSFMAEAPFEKQCEAIRNAKNGVHELQARMDELKGQLK